MTQSPGSKDPNRKAVDMILGGGTAGRASVTSTSTANGTQDPQSTSSTSTTSVNKTSGKQATVSRASGLPSGHKVGSSGAVLAVLCFFMPWLFASCGTQSLEVSGWQMAAGSTVGSGYFAQQLPGQPVLFLVLLAGLAVIGLAYLAWKRGALQSLDGYGLMGLGALALLVLLVQFSGTESQAARQGIYVEYRLGFWGTVLGNIAVILGGLLNARAMRSKP